MKSLAIALAAAALLASTAAVQAAPVTYKLDPTHTYVTFEIDHRLTSTNRGRFDKKEGTVVLDTAARTAKVDVTVDVNSLNSGFEQFNAHVKSGEILDAAKYPTAHFVGDKAVFNGDKLVEVAGTLTLHGKSAPVTLKASRFNCYVNPMNKANTCGGDFAADITRSQFGVSYGLDWGFPDVMRLVIQAEGVQQ